jgi:hypothetical protein
VLDSTAAFCPLSVHQALIDIVSDELAPARLPATTRAALACTAAAVARVAALGGDVAQLVLRVLPHLASADALVAASATEALCGIGEATRSEVLTCLLHKRCISVSGLGCAAREPCRVGGAEPRGARCAAR